MSCPKCNYEQYCPCESCKGRLPKDKKAWVYLGNDIIKCGNCEYSAHIDWWETEELEQYKAIK